MTVRLLALDDDEDILQTVRVIVSNEGFETRTETNPNRLPKLLAEYGPEIVLLDMNYQRGKSSGEEGLRLVSLIKEHDPDTVVIVMTAYADIAIAVSAVKSGAFDFVIKPWENDKLLATLNAAKQLVVSRKDLRRSQAQVDLLREPSNAAPMIGESVAMKSLMDAADKVAPTDANVLLLGENGTGKQMMARYLHDRSARAGEPFVTVDLGAIPESLFESEMFGHIKGAFTGATGNRPGRFVAATGGTIFLDEIGNLPVHLQAKLLVALEERQVYPVGSERSKPFDVRLICATNMSKAFLSNTDLFRSDLLYRINTVELIIPPLRERPQDIPALLIHYLSSYARKYRKPAKPIAASCLDVLSRYSWPGNVRALQHAAERAVIMSEGDMIDLEDFPTVVPQPPQKADEPGEKPRTLNLEQLEENTIREALITTSGNVSQAARLLGLTRAALYRRMEKYAI